MASKGIKLSILIATLGRRENKFKRLLKVLLPQATSEVEVVAFWNNGECTIGDIRQALLEDAKGEYICFVDDDDMVPEYYVKEIIDNLGKDYIGFRVELYNDGNLKPPVTHSLRYPNWFETYDGYYRDITHLNPIRKEIALNGKFNSMGLGEDENWVNQVRPFVKTENYIDRVMYFYYHESLDTAFNSASSHPPEKNYDRPKINNKQFRYHKGSKK